MDASAQVKHFSQEPFFALEASQSCLTSLSRYISNHSCLHRERFVPETPTAEELLRLDKIQADEILVQADFSFEEGDYQEAERLYREALDISPILADGWLKLALFYSTLNRKKDALQIFEIALENLPEQAEIHFEMGLIQVRQRLLSDAILSLSKAALLAPQEPHYSYVYGIALNSYQRADEAIDVLYKAHQIHPDDKEIINGLIAIYQENNNMTLAIEFAEKLLKLEPDNTALKNWLVQLKSEISSIK